MSKDPTNIYEKMNTEQLQRYLAMFQKDVQELQKRSSENEIAYREGSIKQKAINAMPSPFFHPIWNALAPYIALICAFLLFIMLMQWAYRKTSKKKRTPARENSYEKQKKPNFFQRMTNRATNLLTPYLSSVSRINPFRGDPPTIKRPEMGSGRCDNVLWRELNAEGTTGMCGRTYATATTSWTLDTDLMPELTQIPAKEEEKLRGVDGANLQVYIPWKTQATFYVPQCNDAYTISKDKHGNEVRKSAAHLLEDQGLSCKLREFPSTTYSEMYRPKDSKKLDDWASHEDPKCSAATAAPV